MTETFENASDETSFEAIVAHCDDAIISISLNGIVTSWNLGATKLFGYCSDEMIGHHVSQVIPAERHAEEDEILALVGRSESVNHLETQRLRKDGELLDISLTVSPIKDQDGKVLGASQIARDMTARKRADAARQRLIECSQLIGRPFLDGLVEGLAEALGARWVLLCDLHPNNPLRARVLSAWGDGRRQNYFEYDLDGTPCAKVLGDEMCHYPADVSRLFPKDPLLAEIGAESYLGVPLKGTDGRSIGLLALVNDEPLDPTRQPQETLLFYAGRASAELHRLTSSSASERLGRIVEDAASEIFVFDAHSLNFVLVNRGARKNLGYTMDELREITPIDIKPEVSPEQFDALLAPLRSGEKLIQQFNTVHRRKNGSDYNVSVSLQLLQDENRPVFFAAIEDTTERDAALRALEQVSQRLDTVLDNTTMAVFLMDHRQECVYMNPAAERLTGYTFEETKGRPLHDVIHHTYPDGRPFPLHECAIDRAFPEEHRVQGEETFIHKDGSFYPVGFTASPILDANGVAIGTVIEARNITAEIEARAALENFNAALQKRVDETVAEREAIEGQLRQAQKMEAVGKLTGGIAHDFNNLLQVIGGNLQLLTQDVAGNIRAEQRVQNAIAGVSRGAKLAAQLLAFGRRQPLAPKVINLGRLVRGMDDLLRRALGEGVEVETIIAGGLWNALVDETQVENAILNLAINARDAMNGHGKLTIEAGNAYLDDRYARQHPDIEPGQYVLIAVTDTGSGMSQDIIDQVFEPFFTTKPPGQGTGLGLSMVYGLVKQSNGHIKVYSELGEGTTFRIYLPRIRQQEAIASVTWTGPARGGSETILVVEDDDDVRATVVELLVDLEYKVLRARDATSGLAIVESGMPIDLLFTDVVMPGPLKSHEMAKRAQELIPGLAVLFTSGYTENSIVHGGRLDESVELLSKPYTRDELAHRVRACLDRDSRRASKLDIGSAQKQDEARTLSVLLVEDEPLILMAASDMVSDFGHTVFEAGTAAKAMAILQDNAIDVMITDIGLPDVSGTSLAQEVQTRWPAIRIIIASGLSASDLKDGAQLGTQVKWLAKPYDVEDLRQVLD
ncbi:PAS domain S-box protein [Rhizobium sp. R86522]|uniref:PAS domain S-box protein n=1 Tax=Rhizobium sp. R86522 TaxID=3093861 RepID=UPI00366B5F65